MNVNYLMTYLYGLYTTNASSVWDVQFTVDGEVSPWTRYHLKKWLQSDIDDRVKYLRQRYQWKESGGGWVFSKGCFTTIMNGPLPGIVTVTYKGRSEWFRKIISDYLFIRGLTGCKAVEFHIPNLWIRRFELLVMVEWARSRGLKVHQTHAGAYESLLKKYPLDRAVKESHSITRRYLLRYYFLHGQLSRERYLYHVHKMWSERAGHEKEWDTV